MTPSNTSNEVKTTVSDVLDEYMSEAWREGHNEQPYSEVEYWKAECLATIEKLLLEVIRDAEIKYEKYGECPACTASMMYQCSCDTASLYTVNKIETTLKAVLYGEQS